MEDWVKKLFMEAKPGEDVHKLRAAKMFNVPYDEVTDEQRRAAKQQNFYDLYSMPLPGDELEASPLQKALMAQLQREEMTPTGRRPVEHRPDFQELPKHDTRMRDLLKKVGLGRQPTGSGYQFVEFDSSRTDYGDVEMRVLVHDEVAPVTVHKSPAVGKTFNSAAVFAAGRQIGKREFARVLARELDRVSHLPPALTGPARRSIVKAVRYAVANWLVDTDQKV